MDFALITSAEGDVGGRVATGLVGWLLKSPQADSPMSHLDTVRITGATMMYEDLQSGENWDMPVGHLVLRREAHGLSGEGSVRIDASGRLSDVAVAGVFHETDRRLEVTASFSDIAPDVFAGLNANLELLTGIGTPISGTVVVGVSLDGDIDTVGFNVTASAGVLKPPQPFDQPINVESIRARGLFDGRSAKLTVDEAEIRFPAGTRIDVPAPIAHTFPVKSIQTQANIDLAKRAFRLSGLSVDLGGPKFRSEATVVVSPQGDMTVTAQSELIEVPVDEVGQYWPKSLGSDAHAWVAENLRGGLLSTAEAALTATVTSDGELLVNELSGSMSASGVEVSYLKGLPPVADAAALMTFDANVFDIAVERGKAGDVMVAGGTVHISGLQDEDQYADIDLRLEAPLRGALELIDHEPLGFASEMGIDLASTDGASEIDLTLRLLLAKDLTLDEVDISASAALREVHMSNVVLGRDVENGELQLTVDKDGMDVRGTVSMEDIPAQLEWRENFLADAPFKANFVLSADIADIHDLENLGIQAAPLTHRYISGGAQASVRYTVFDSRLSRVDVNADITNANLVVPVMSWRKAQGEPGRAAVTILLENNLVKSVPAFEITSAELSVAGDIVYGPAGLGLERVNFDKIQHGRTNVAGAIISRPDGGWELGLHGPSIDVSPLWDRVIHDEYEDEEADLPNLTVAIEFDQLWIDRSRFMTDVSGTFVHRHNVWRTVLLDTKLNGEDPFTISMAPDDTGSRVLSIRAENAGESLRFLDLFENMHGGFLEIRGRYDDAAPGQPLRGELRAANYRVRNAPLLTRILSVMALTGILEAMTGEGLSFTALEIPFTYKDGVLDIADAKATGPSLGFTATGTVYTHADVLDLSGTVVPVYALNSLLGNIPILGDILTGTEEGGGVFAANFAISGPVEDPETTVNPLSALTPGIFRNLFGALAPQSDSSDTPTLLGDPETPLQAR